MFLTRVARETGADRLLQQMATTQPDLVSALMRAIPRQREYVDHEQVLADDRLIEAIRAGRITESDPVSPLVRMLARWRSQVVAGT